MRAPSVRGGASLRSALLGLLVRRVSPRSLGGTELLRAFELRTVDLRFRLRGDAAGDDRRSRSSSSATTASRRYGRWPWSWEYHALLDRRAARGPARGWSSSTCSSPRRPRAADERLLAATARAAGNVYFISSFGGTRPRPTPGTRLAARGRRPHRAAPGAAGRGRRRRPRQRGARPRRGDPAHPGRRPPRRRALPLGGAARRGRRARGAARTRSRLTPGGDVELRPPGRPPVRIPVDAEGMTPLNFAGGARRLPAALLLPAGPRGRRAPRRRRRSTSRRSRTRSCVVGVTFAGNADLQPTPFSTAYPMFLVQATMIDNILARRVPAPPAGVGRARALPAARRGPRRPDLQPSARWRASRFAGARRRPGTPRRPWSPSRAAAGCCRWWRRSPRSSPPTCS